MTYLIEGCHAKFGHPLVLIGIFGLSVPSIYRQAYRRGGQKRLRQSRREIFTRRNGILLWKQLSWWPWHRLHRWLQNRPDMHRPSDWQQTPHYSCERAGSSTGELPLSYYMSGRHPLYPRKRTLIAASEIRVLGDNRNLYSIYVVRTVTRRVQDFRGASRGKANVDFDRLCFDCRNW